MDSVDAQDAKESWLCVYEDFYPGCERDGLGRFEIHEKVWVQKRRKIYAGIVLSKYFNFNHGHYHYDVRLGARTCMQYELPDEGYIRHVDEDYGPHVRWYLRKIADLPAEAEPMYRTDSFGVTRRIGYKIRKDRPVID